MTISQVHLFRHCVRSTKESVKFNDDDLYANFSSNPIDYLANVSDYNWGVPDEWCTPVGLEIMRGTGRRLGETLKDVKSSNGSLKIRILSDVAERDVQSSLALSMGLAEVLGSSSIGGSGGLAEIILDPDIFNPFVLNNYTKTTLCSKPDPDAVEAEIKARLAAFPAPSSVSIEDAMKIINEHASLLWDNTQLEYNISGHDFTGLPNLLSHFGEMTFYSRASALDPPFLPNMTVDHMYDLLTWNYYMRFVANSNNTYVAARGAVMADTVLRALDEETGDEEDATVTIIVGHDGDLNALSTAMGLRWRPLASPTYRYTDLQMTPPGSGISFNYNREEQQLQASFVFPELVDVDGSVDRSGNLRYTPIHWTHTSSSSSGLSSVREYLNDRVESILENDYGAEALACYKRAQNRTRPFEFSSAVLPDVNATNGTSSSSGNITIITGDDSSPPTVTPAPGNTLGNGSGSATHSSSGSEVPEGYLVAVVVLTVMVFFFGFFACWGYFSPALPDKPRNKKAKGSEYTSAIVGVIDKDDPDFEML